MMANPQRRPRRHRKVLAASAVLALAALPGLSPASAETYVDPADRCLPDAVAPRAPVSDYDQIAPVHQQSVDCAFAEGYSIGRVDGTFGPRGFTTRGQMASFIVRALEAAGYDLPPATDPGFTDIGGNTHEENIKILATIGVTEGKTATTYSPQEFVRRDQMASFLVRAAEYAFGDDRNGFMAIGEIPAFVDVPASNVHANNVAAANEVVGLTDGKTPTMYQPRAFTQRQQMASFLTRLVDFTLIVE